jgi:dipeptidase
MRFIVFAISFFIFFHQLFGCTTILVTKKASVDGSIFVTHSDDDDLGDQRIIYVPAKDFPHGSKRAIAHSDPSGYPRYVGDRCKAYNISTHPQTKIDGYIDEISHTYAYFDGNYGIINEHQLALGECTNSTKFYFDSGSKDRLFEISELSHIALERCIKAKDAIKLIGELAEKYGYYGFGETLLIADKNEGWVFEISSTPDGKGALWVAKKVPDGEVFVAANEFRIQDVIVNSNDMLFSANLFKVAEEQKVWKKGDKEPLNWLKLVCPGEFDHPYYSLRRVWRVFSLINPSLNLSPWVKDSFTKEYPFSIKPEKKLALQDVMRLHRDFYEGTEFDLTKGLAAGPYGCPYRYLGKYDTTDFPDKRTEALEGAWERPISVYYVGYTYINQIRSSYPDVVGGVTWISFDAPYSGCFMPIYIGMGDLPDYFQYGDTQKFSQDFIFHPFNFVGNWLSMNYENMIVEVVKKQKELEKKEFDYQTDLERQAMQLYNNNPDVAKRFLQEYCFKNSQEVMKEWIELGYYLVGKFSDNFNNIPKAGQRIGYPKWWREAVGYQNGPTQYEKK